MRFSYKIFLNKLRWELWVWYWNWRTFTGMLEALEHQSNLLSLVDWVGRKRLHKTKGYYQNLLIQVEGRLSQKFFYNRRIFVLAEWAYAFQKQIAPKPAYRREVAQKYRKRLFVDYSKANF